LAARYKEMDGTHNDVDGDGDEDDKEVVGRCRVTAKPYRRLQSHPTTSDAMRRDEKTNIKT
jgi:hypothetical protein